ncbi:hypothetical protein [Dickeya dadantii]|uniref:hypothetical protein n=1 Tax=Dickeya dadantii TaxID=204038 RepID=UPI0012685116|nr:hypothetical protein [Dickeya dadantii]NPE58356.1 hypothetical protein [Dickeya dadantii]NPE69348.1 hypothetical protein [Dickeya dadantii]
MTREKATIERDPEEIKREGMANDTAKNDGKARTPGLPGHNLRCYKQKQGTGPDSESASHPTERKIKKYTLRCGFFVNK